MKNKFILPMVLMLTFSFSAYAQADLTKWEKHIRSQYAEVVKEVQLHGLEGPIAVEASKLALMRRILEDGVDRPPGVSINGMSLGSPNKEIINRLNMPNHTISKVRDSDGQGCYVITGPRANIMGAAAIALWYDEIVNSTQFRICNDKEQQVWNISKLCSRQMAGGDTVGLSTFIFNQLIPLRTDILKKVNNAYGPKGRVIHQLSEKLSDVFREVTK